MKTGQFVTVLRPGESPGDPATADLALVVKTGTARQGTAEYPTASLRIFERGAGVPYVENVIAYDTEAEARAEGAGRWSMYACYADAGAGDSLPDVGATGAAPAAVPQAPPPDPAPTFS